MVLVIPTFGMSGDTPTPEHETPRSTGESESSSGYWLG
jgi:hypothetical protein